MTGDSLAVNARADNHDIVDDGKAAFAANPPTRLVLDLAVIEHCRLVRGDLVLKVMLRIRYFLPREKFPAGTVDDFIGGVAEDVDDGLRRVEDTSFGCEICSSSCQWLRS